MEGASLLYVMTRGWQTGTSLGFQLQHGHCLLCGLPGDAQGSASHLMEGSGDGGGVGGNVGLE